MTSSALQRYDDAIPRSGSSLVKFAEDDVPDSVRPLAEEAERWGYFDDDEREKLVSEASADELRSLCEAVDKYADALDEWLAGPAADSPSYPPEYIAFSAMRMAADSAAIELKERLSRDNADS